MYQNNTKASENEIYNLLHEFDNIESSFLNRMTKHQEYQSFTKWNHYSSFDKLVKHIGALMKFKEIWLLKQQNKDKENCYKKLSVENLNKAEFEIYREAQLESFALNLITFLPINPSQIKIKFYHLLQFLLKFHSSWWQSAKIRHTVISQTSNCSL